MSAIPAPAVDLSIRARYPMSPADIDDPHFDALVREDAEVVQELLGQALGTTDVDVEWEIDAEGLEFEGGALVPADFHGLGEE